MNWFLRCQLQIVIIKRVNLVHAGKNSETGGIQPVFLWTCVLLTNTSGLWYKKRLLALSLGEGFNPRGCG